MATNRSVSRLELAEVLREHCPAAQAVYAYKVADLGGKTPVIVLASSGSERFPWNPAKFAVAVNNLVLYSFEDESYTREDAENLLDLLESQVSTLVTDFQGYKSLMSIDYDGRSIIDEVSVGGITYLSETIILLVGVSG